MPNPRVFRITARRTGNAGILTIALPVPMSKALPDGGHVFDASFADDGIHLTYVGPNDGTRPSTMAEETPAWAKDAQ